MGNIRWKKVIKIEFSYFAVGNDNENAKTHLRLLAEVARTLGNDECSRKLC